MNNRYKGEIDGFWLFLILMFVIVPLGTQLINKLPGGKEDAFTNDVVVEVPRTGTEESTTEAINIPIVAEGKLLTIYLVDDISTHTTNLNREIKFRVPNDVVRAVLKSPKKKEIKISVKNGYVSNVFNEEGLWEITTYDENGETKGWHKINVY